MNLFQHNKDAYDSAVKIFRHSNKACIIHPTGTGKAVIIAKFISDHPHDRHLLLAPSSQINNEVSKHAPKSTFTFRTYHSISSPTKIKQLKGFDYIYLDEFHRAGADIWGPMIARLIKSNPKSKILGTTATHIRFLDENRDMAFELFKNNIASQISLSKAFLSGILKAPIYISAMYSIPTEYKEIEKRIKASRIDDKKQILTDLRKNVIDWKRSSGIDVILKKHLPSNRKKIIVFCKNFTHMKTAHSTLVPILKRIYPKLLALHVHSKYPYQSNQTNLSLFNKESQQTRVLFTVDMMNEGLHGKDISVVIQLRETTSPIIFYQQIGRCFSVGQKHRPIIIDLVNNFRTVQLQMFKRDYEEEASQGNAFPMVNGKMADARKKHPMAIEFIDETQTIHELIISFDNKIDTWALFFNQAQAFHSKNGHLVVPRVENAPLARWIWSQRLAYKAGKLQKDRIDRLSDIGMNWGNYEQRWMANYSELKAFIVTNGSCPLPRENRKLSLWLKTQREKHAIGSLSAKQQKLLTSIISMKKARKALWDIKLKSLRAFLAQNRQYVLQKGNPMYKLIRHFRVAHKKNSLPTDVVKQLQRIDFPFGHKRSWKENFDLLKTFQRSNRGKRPTDEQDKLLSSWVRKQRYLYKIKQLKKEHIALLTSTAILADLASFNKSRTSADTINKQRKREFIHRRHTTSRKTKPQLGHSKKVNASNQTSHEKVNRKSHGRAKGPVKSN